jgi:hypothetical protein
VGVIRLSAWILRSVEGECRRRSPQEFQVSSYSRREQEAGCGEVQHVSRQVGDILIEQARQGNQGAVPVSFCVGEGNSEELLAPQVVGASRVDWQHGGELGILTGLKGHLTPHT